MSYGVSSVFGTGLRCKRRNNAEIDDRIQVVLCVRCAETSALTVGWQGWLHLETVQVSASAPKKKSLLNRRCAALATQSRLEG